MGLRVRYLNRLACDACMQGQFDDAIGLFDEAIKLKPRNAETWYNKGVAYMLAYQEVAAIDCFAKAIDLNPRNADYWNNKGRCLYILSDTNKGEAIQCFQKALDLKPGNTAFRKNMEAVASGIYDESRRNI